MDNQEKNFYNNKIVFRNASWSIVIKIFNLCMSLMLAPLILQCLGIEKYGVWVTLLGFISWIYYFDFGIINGLRFKLTTFLSLGDKISSKKVVTVTYVLLAGFVLIFFAAICLFVNTVDLQEYFHLNDINENLRMVLVVSLGLACINFVLSVDAAILKATQQVAKATLFEFLGQIFYFLLIYIYVQYKISWLFWVAVGQGVCQLLRHFFASGFVFWQNKYLLPHFNHIDFKYTDEILSYGLMIFVMQIAALILNTTDNIIILKYYGGDAVTPYSFCYRYFDIINMFFVTALSPVWSTYTAAYARKDIEWIVSMMKKSGMLYGLALICTILAGYIFEPFAKWWLQKELYYQPGLIFLTGLYFVLLMCSHIFSTFVNGIGVLKTTTIGVLLEAVLNIPISIFLAVSCNMGVNGVILGSIVCMGIALVVYPYVAIIEIKRIRRNNL